MSRSGADIEAVGLGDEVMPFEDVVWRVSDDDPRVLLRFTAGFVPEPRRPIAGEWAPNDDRRLPGNWWRWRPLGASKDTARTRRCGNYDLAFASPPDRRIRILLFSQRVLEEDEYDRMIEEIEAAFPGGVWDTPERSPSRGAYRLAPRVGRRAALSLLRAVEEELAAARRIVRRPAWDLAPPLPGRPPSPGSGPPRTFDVVENRVALSWARRRARQLRECGALVAGTITALQDFVDSVARARGVVPIEAWVTAQQGHLRRLEALARSLADTTHAVQRVASALAELDVHSNWEMTPAVRRKPDSHRLAAAHVEDEIWAEVRAAREALAPFLTTASLFELWAALEQARGIEALGFVPVGPPAVIAAAGEALPGIPTRAQWTFRRDDHELRLFLMPTTRRFSTRLAANHGWASANLSCLDAVAVNAVEHGHRSLFVGFGEAIEPDYAMVLVRGDRAAACVGDALFSDTTLDSGLGSIREKVSKIRRTYARKIGWIDARGRLCPCVPTASFAVVPRDFEGDLKLADEEQEIRLLVMAPYVDEARRAGARASLGKLLASLEWHLVHRPPLSLSQMEHAHEASNG
ncbi:hypothetical protein [Nannocystis pusilla]|uniref:hypothetical protein n=1 Tax=Nannocystis pusilla TaxID=889268 RepID=UPI003DA5CAAD